jgi:hypothetical protein
MHALARGLVLISIIPPSPHWRGTGLEAGGWRLEAGSNSIGIILSYLGIWVATEVVIGRSTYI